MDTVCIREEMSAQAALPYTQLAKKKSRRNYMNARQIRQTSFAVKSLARPGKKQATATEGFQFHIPHL